MAQKQQSEKALAVDLTSQDSCVLSCLNIVGLQYVGQVFQNFVFSILTSLKFFWCYSQLHTHTQMHTHVMSCHVMSKCAYFGDVCKLVIYFSMADTIQFCAVITNSSKSSIKTIKLSQTEINILHEYIKRHDLVLLQPDKFLQYWSISQKSCVCS